MYRLADINALLILLMAAFAGCIRGVARVCVAGLNCIKGFGTGRALMPRPSRPSGSVREAVLSGASGWAIVVIALVTLALPAVSFAAPYGTVVTNNATLSFIVPFDGPGVLTRTDSVNFTVDRHSLFEVLRFSTDPAARTYDMDPGLHSDDAAGSSFSSNPSVPPTYPPAATPINILSPVPLEPMTALNLEDPIFLVVNDVAENTDPLVVEYVDVTVSAGAAGEAEIIRLVETAPDSGFFTAYVQTVDAVNVPVTAYDGFISLTSGDSVSIAYTDADSTTSSATLTATPFVPIPGALFVIKKVNKDSASVGDYLQYRITVDEAAVNTVVNTVVTDKLPFGFVYIAGTAMINGSSAPDPSLSADRRTLTFRLGDMSPSASAEIKYVVAVATGKSGSIAVNTAYAAGDNGELSNQAEASVKIREDLFRSSATIMGRVVADSCGLDPKARDKGMKGVRIYMEDGTYVVTDEKGMFHFKGVKPGGHVVQLDHDSLPVQYETVLCTDTTDQAGSSFSRFVDLQGGALWRTDFHLALKSRNKGELRVRFDSSLSGVDKVRFSVPMEATEVSVDNVRVTFILPKGIEYEKGSSALNGKAIDDPEVMGGTLAYRLGGLEGGSDNRFEFMGRTVLEGQTGTFVSKMLVVFDTPGDRDLRMPELDNVFVRDLDELYSTKSFILSTQFEPLRSELTEKEKSELNRLSDGLKDVDVDHIFTFGYTDSLRLSKKARQTYADNYELSRARAKTVAMYIGEKLGLKEHDISFVGHGPDKPIGDNSTREGRKKNRRVEIKVFHKDVERSYKLATREGSSGSATMDTTVKMDEQTAEKTDPVLEDEAEKSMPVFDELWMSEASEGLGWAWPEDGVHPAMPALTMAIRHKPGNNLTLTLNGEPVKQVYMEYTKVNKGRTKAVTVYKGIPIEDGDNSLVVSQMIDGKVIDSFTRNVHYSTAPVDAVVLPDKSRLVADGRTSPVVAVRLTDQDGYPVRRNTVGQFSVDAPHKSLDAETGAEAFLMDGRSRYTVGSDGIAYIKLAPTSQTGEASLTIHMKDGDKKVSTWLSPEMRDWILVGFAEGTLGHATLEGNAEALLENAYEEGSYTDGKVSFFAKGRIKGSWLLTMAYDSDKPSYNEYELHSIIDPDEYYTLYGDSTEQGYEASSARKLYLKIESDKFYALFGDYDTGLTVTRLSRYSRSMNGFKSEYNGERLRYRVFASDTSQAFVKDEIPGDGTSGLYRLSRRNIVLNSDKISIQVRDRFSPDMVLESRRLSRHVDYDIDYQEGTLYFKEPVYSSDGSFNPIFIVVDYESFDDSDTSLNYGGRGAVSMAGDRVEVGATFVHEESVGREGDLAGYDATLRLDESTEVKAEFAATETADLTGSRDGSAYLVEVNRKQKRLNARVYLQESDVDFGLGQQSVSERGLRKYGLDFSYEVDKTLRAGGRAYKQENLITQAEREFGEADLRYNTGDLTYIAGLRFVTDAFDDGRELTSDQMTAGLEWLALDRRLTLKLMRDQAISDNDDNADYPNRTTLGAEYRLTDKTSVFVNQEYAESDELDYQATRAGIKTSPWTGADVNSSLERQFNENGARVFSNFGLIQNMRLSDNWGLSAGLDSRDTLKNTQVSNVSNSASAPSEDFTAISVGATYSRKGFAWRNRFEYREAESYDKSGFFSAVNGEPSEGLGLSAGLRGLNTKWTGGAMSRDLSLRLGFVRRPAKARWIVLDRFDYISEEEKGGQLEFDTWRVVNNLNVNYRLEEKYQVSVQYGSKYVKDSIDGLDFKGYTDLKGLEARYNINRKWDMGMKYSMLYSYEPGRYDYQSGISVGYSYTRNVWLSMGYNFDGFRDRDFSAANYTADGPFLRFKVKFDQLTARDAVRYFTGN
jgi:uncharacterized repeat protein (TIGR01451 family)